MNIVYRRSIRLRVETPFSIADEQVAGLSAEQQAELFNLLIRDEARRLGMDTSQVLTTDAIDVADEAIDAITLAGPAGGDHIPQGDTLWQFKKPKPDWKKLGADLEKSETVQEFFGRGSGYVYIEGNRLPAATSRRRFKTLQQVASDAGCSGPIDFISADRVAAWATSVPAAVFILQRETREYFRADRVLLGPPHAGIGYQPDVLRDDIIRGVRQMLFATDSSAFAARVVGPADVGKRELKAAYEDYMSHHASDLK